MSAAPTPYTTITASLLDHADVYETPQVPDPLLSPAYKAALAARDEAERRVEVERTRPLPDVNFSLGVRKFSGHERDCLGRRTFLPHSHL